MKVFVHLDTPTPAGQPATGETQLRFIDDNGNPVPLKDDRYTLFIKDTTVVDPAGNILDGESNAAEPLSNPTFPTGNGAPGGDFLARFTIDSRPEIGVYSAGAAFVDINGNYYFDPQGFSADYSNRDFVFQFGGMSDALFAGQFVAANASINDGFDRIGAYGYDNNAKQYRFLLDFNNDGVGDKYITSAFQVNGFPVAGHFAPGHVGEQIGLFDGQNWYLDNVGDNQLHIKIASNMKGKPLVGDFNGDGQSDLATFDAGTNTFYFDLNRDGQADDTLQIAGPINGFTEIPFAGDMNLDGIDDLGIYVPNRQGDPTPGIAEWYMLLSDHTTQHVPSKIFDQYSPAPLGNDLFAQLGTDFALPIFGNFDPPTAPASVNAAFKWNTNPANPFDVDGDGVVAPRDLTVLIGQLNSGVQPTPPASGIARAPYTDIDGDGTVSPKDLVFLISYLNGHGATTVTIAGPTSDSGSGEGEGEGESSLIPAGAADTNDDLLSLLSADVATATVKKKS